MKLVAEMTENVTYLNDLNNIDFFLNVMNDNDEIIVNNEFNFSDISYTINKSVFGYLVYKQKFVKDNYLDHIEDLQEIMFDNIEDVEKYFANQI